MTYTQAFSVYGLQVSNKEGQIQTTCLWCHKDKFFLDATTGLWDCKLCGLQGNYYTFLQEIHRRAYEDTADHYESLSENRSLSVSTLRQWQVAYHPLTDQWLLPAFNIKGKLANLYRCSPTHGYKPYSSPTCKQQLFLPAPLAGLLPSYSFPIRSKSSQYHFCEGPWDAMALWEIFSRLTMTSPPKNLHTVPPLTSLSDANTQETSNRARSLLNYYRVIGLPGAGTFREDWASLITQGTAHFYFDHDEAGERGLDRAVKAIGVQAKTDKDLPKAVYSLRWVR